MEELTTELFRICRVEARSDVPHRVRAARESGKQDLLGMALQTLPASIGKCLPALRHLAVNTNSLAVLPGCVVWACALLSPQQANLAAARDVAVAYADAAQ